MEDDEKKSASVVGGGVGVLRHSAGGGGHRYSQPSDQASLLSGVVVGLITAGAVYSKQRLVDAKDERIHGGVLQITEVGDKKCSR
jgi:hypothetical protein